MALFRKAGSLLSRTVTSSIKQEISASTPSIFQTIRCMSSPKVFIGGLSYNTDDTGLREAFDKYGQIIDARVIVDRETGRSRGFGFVTYNSPEEASAAIQALDQQELHGRVVKVNYANERQSGGGGFRSGGFGGGGGGYGGNYGGGGGGGYGGGGYGGGGNYGSGGYGSSGVYGGGSNYNSGGSSYGGGAAADTYPPTGGETQTSYGGSGQNFDVAGGAGGSEAGTGNGGFDNNYDTPDNFADRRG